MHCLMDGSFGSLIYNIIEIEYRCASEKHSGIIFIVAISKQ